MNDNEIIEGLFARDRNRPNSAAPPNTAALPGDRQRVCCPTAGMRRSA